MQLSVLECGAAPCRSGRPAAERRRHVSFSSVGRGGSGEQRAVQAAGQVRGEGGAAIGEQENILVMSSLFVPKRISGSRILMNFVIAF